MIKTLFIPILSLFFWTCEWAPEQIAVVDNISYQTLNLAVGDTSTISLGGYEFSSLEEPDTAIVSMGAITSPGAGAYTLIGRSAGQTTLSIEYLQYGPDGDVFKHLSYIHIVVSDGIAQSVFIGEERLFIYADYLSPTQQGQIDSLHIEVNGDTGNEVILQFDEMSHSQLAVLGAYPGGAEILISFFDPAGALITSLLFECTVSIRKLALAELFTNSGCVNCPEANHYMDNILAEYNDEMALVRYHVNWTDPRDPMNLYNPTEVLDRVLYYGVFTAPSFVLEGSKVSTLNETDWISRIDAAQGVEAQIYISPIDLEATMDSLLHLRFDLESFGAELGSLDVWSMIIEDSIYFAGSNGEEIHMQVMRDMTANAASGVLDALELTTTLTQPPAYGSGSPMSLIVFVQDTETQAVLQTYKQIIF